MYAAYRQLNGIFNGIHGRVHHCSGGWMGQYDWASSILPDTDEGEMKNHAGC